jgi:predicted HTH domain antitoxin
MPVIIPDETLKQAGLTEREMKVEIACRLYDADKLELWPAAQLAGVSRGEFEDELMSRRIPVYRPTVEDFQKDLKALDEMFGRTGDR